MTTDFEGFFDDIPQMTTDFEGFFDDIPPSAHGVDVDHEAATEVLGTCERCYRENVRIMTTVVFGLDTEVCIDLESCDDTNAPLHAMGDDETSVEAHGEFEPTGLCGRCGMPFADVISVGGILVEVCQPLCPSPAGLGEPGMHTNH